MNVSRDGFTILTTKWTQKEKVITSVEVTELTSEVKMSSRQEKPKEYSEANEQPPANPKRVKLKRPSKMMKIKEAERKLYENLKEMIPTISQQRTKPTRVEILTHTTEYMNVLERMLIDLKAGDAENLKK